MAIGVLGALSLAATAGSSLLGAYSSLQAGADEYGASILNSSRLLEAARRTRLMTKVDLYRQNKYSEQVRGSQVAAIGKSGGSLDDPTSQAILRDTAEQASIDAWLIKYGGAMKARDLETQAADVRRQGRNAMRTGKLNAFASILGGAGSLYGSYKGMVG